MMMDCPRCGFSQPKDRFCAQCGLDVEHYKAKPQPWIIRMVQNSTLHLSLIAVLMLLAIGYIMYSQIHAVRREAHQILGIPLPVKSTEQPSEPIQASAPFEESAPVAAAPQTAVTPTAAVVKEPEKPAVAQADPQRITLTFFEVSHDTLADLATVAERTVSDGSGGRGYLFLAGQQVLESLRSSSRPLGRAREDNLTTNASLLISSPETASEPLAFGFSVHVSRWENKEASLRWDLSLVLPAQDQDGGQVPVVKMATESQLTGTATLKADHLLVILIEPPNRRAREDQIAKLGPGPWSILTSREFHSGQTEWIAVLQLK